MGGKGRALAAWDCFRIGLDPLLFHDPSVPEEVLDSAVKGLIPPSSSSSNPVHTKITTRNDLTRILPAKRRGNGLGLKSLGVLSTLYPEPPPVANADTSLQLELGGIESSVAKLVQVQTSRDGTTKLLLNLYSSPAHFIEAVIIPWHDRGHSTICVSSQVGCRQGCTFCATGRMGRLLDLTTDEILIQLYYANKVCRILGSNDDSVPLLPPIDNVVFMGMGEPTDNLQAVIPAVHRMVSQTGAGFQLSPAKITVSTVAPTPHVFRELAAVPATLAWSVHAVRDSLRKELVPTTRYSMAELRAGLVDALRLRKDWGNRMWTVMLEVALIEGVNDGVLEAEELADFSIRLVEEVGDKGGRGGLKLIVNLIPFNDIGHETYRSPSVERVVAFQKVLVDKGVLTYIRTTRGDDESAACGQLATKRTSKADR